MKTNRDLLLSGLNEVKRTESSSPTLYFCRVLMGPGSYLTIEPALSKPKQANDYFSARPFHAGNSYFGPTTIYEFLGLEGTAN